MRRYHSITETPNLCEHMKRIVSHIDHIKSFFPSYFNKDNDILPSGEMEEAVNNDDAGIIVKDGSFNTETGLWEYLALPPHKPKDMMDKKLHSATQICDKFATSEKIDEKYGLRLYHLKPRQHNLLGNPRKCECGREYNPENCYKEVQETTLYTQFSPLKCLCYNMVCSKNNCQISFQETAEAKGIFFLFCKNSSYR